MDSIDLGILYFLDIDSRRPVTEIAAILGEKKEKVNYRLNRMFADGTIKRCYAEVNPWKIGYTSYKVYLQFQGVDEKTVDEMYSFLSKEGNVNWIVSCLGRWDMVIDVLAKNRHEFHEIYSRFHRKYSRHILNKVVGVTLEMFFINKKWLSQKKGQVSTSILSGLPEKKADDLDMEILRHLVRRGREPVRQLAEELKIPQTTLSQRINNLAKKEVIANFRCDVDLARFGRIFCKAFVYFSTAPREEEKKLIEYCIRHPDIIFINKIIAPWEMEIDAHAKSFNEFTDMMNDLRERFPHIIRNFEAVAINRGTGSFQSLPPVAQDGRA